MIEFRKVINTFLKDIHPNVYFQNAPEDALFPYLVYDIISIQAYGEDMKTAMVDIDGWDMPGDGDTTALETIMEAVNALDKQTVITDKLVVTFYLDRILAVMDDDKRIKRRKYIYEVRIFEGS